MKTNEFPSMEHPVVPPLQELVFSEARSLLAGRSMNRWDGVIAVGHHCSIRARIIALPGDQLCMRLAFRAFEPMLVDWSVMLLTVWCEVGNVKFMPFEQRLTPDGQAEFDLPIRSDAGTDIVTTLRTPLCLVRRLPEIRTADAQAAQTADIGSSPASCWTTVEGIPHYRECSSDDRRLTACYDESEHTLHFRAKGEWSGYSVAWALGGHGEIERSGLALLQDRGSGEWSTDSIEISVSFPRQLYFELAPAPRDPDEQQ